LTNRFKSTWPSWVSLPRAAGSVASSLIRRARWRSWLAARLSAPSTLGPLARLGERRGDVGRRRRVLRQRLGDEAEVRHHVRERVVELVGHARHQRPERRHALGHRQLRPHLAPLGVVEDEGHAVVAAGQQRSPQDHVRAPAVLAHQLALEGPGIAAPAEQLGIEIRVVGRARREQRAPVDLEQLRGGEPGDAPRRLVGVDDVVAAPQRDADELAVEHRVEARVRLVARLAQHVLVGDVAPGADHVAALLAGVGDVVAARADVAHGSVAAPHDAERLLDGRVLIAQPLRQIEDARPIIRMHARQEQLAARALRRRHAQEAVHVRRPPLAAGERDRARPAPEIADRLRLLEERAHLAMAHVDGGGEPRAPAVELEVAGADLGGEHGAVLAPVPHHHPLRRGRAVEALERRDVLGQAQLAQRHAEELFAREAVLAHRRVVDLEERHRLDPGQPGRLRNAVDDVAPEVHGPLQSIRRSRTKPPACTLHN
jgi:hypothetical protein